MKRSLFAARLWLALVAISGVALTGWSSRWSEPITQRDWLALSLLAVCAALTYLLPVRSTAGSSYSLSNVFLIAGVIILPTRLLGPLLLLAFLPEVIACWRRGSALRQVFMSLPPVVLATQVAGMWIAASGVRAVAGVGDLLLVVIGGFLYIVILNGAIGFEQALVLRLPPHRAEQLSPTALVSEGLFGILGITIASLWLNTPAVLLLILPLLIAANRLTRTAHLARLAQVDVKTGLHNARYFEQVLASEVARSQRLNQPLGLIFADLDHFKRVNDEHGHASGDLVLQQFASLFAGILRKSDIVARFGGEEFVALLPGTDPDEALFIAECVRAAVADQPFTLADGGSINCTVSLGVAVSPHDGQTVAALLAQADAAMYRAKQTRNAVARVSTLPAVPRLTLEIGAPAVAPIAGAALRHRRDWVMAVLTAFGLAVIGWGGSAIGDERAWRTVLPFALLAAAAELLTVRIAVHGRSRLTLAFSVAVIMAMIPILPQATPLVALAAAVARIVNRRHWQYGPRAIIFTLTATLFAAGVSVAAVLLLGRTDSLALLLAVPLYYLVIVTVRGLIPPHGKDGTTLAGLREVLWSLPAFVLFGGTGVLLGLLYGHSVILSLVACGVPIVIMRLVIAYLMRKNGQELMAAQAARAETEQAHEEKERGLRELIGTIATLVDARDQAIDGHSTRVAHYAVALGETLSASPRELAYLHTAGLLHDVGKIGVSEAILLKPGKLTPEEYATVREHAAIGERLLAEVGPFAEIAEMIGDHHERFDGRGYPHGERGETITRGGRILAVADALDTILSDHPYSRGRSLDWALAELDRCAGTQFDPTIVAAVRELAATRPPEFFGAADVDAHEEVARGGGLVVHFPSGSFTSGRDTSPPTRRSSAGATSPLDAAAAGEPRGESQSNDPFVRVGKAR